MIRIKLLAFVLAIFQFNFASAAVHYVTESGTGDASSWGAAGNLHTALTTAAFGDEIWIAGGNYFPHASDATVRYEISTANVSIYGGFNGAETSLMERDFVKNPTVLSGEIQNDANDQNNTDIVFSVNAANTIVDGLIIEKGYGSSGGGGIWQSSQGLYAEYHNLILRNNKSVTNGGAMSLPNSGTSANIYNCIFENNSVDGASSDVGALIAQAKVEIYNSIFVGNSAVRNQGAALFYTTGGGKVVNCVFYNNTAASTQDGGINIAVTYEVKNSIFWDNTAPSSPNVNFAAGVTSSHCIIQGASSASWPGGSFGSDGGNNENLDPMFSDNVNPAGADGKWFTADDGLMLSASSPAIDKASAGGLTQDILGNLNVGPADIGAYEYRVSGRALRFDGVDDYVNIPETASLTWSGNLSVSAWIMMDPSSSGAERAIVSKYNGTSGFMFSVSTGDKLALTVGNGSTDLLEDSTPLPMGVWLHVATTFDSISQTMMLYVDGQPVAQKVASVGLDNNNGASMRIARFTHTTGGFFTGMMDEVSVWDRVIDVTSFGKVLPAGDVNLLGGYNFDNGTGSIASDIRALNDGSIIGGADWVGSGANPKALRQVWYVKSIPLGSMDGSDWSSAANIEDALLLAKPGDEIWVAAGNYLPHTNDVTKRFEISTPNVSIYGGFNGSEITFNERDFTNNHSILSGEIQGDANDLNNTDIVFSVNAANTIMDGLIIEKGYGTSGGGGIWQSSQGTYAEYHNLILRDNKSVTNGGAMSLPNSGTSANIYNCVFENNSVVGAGSDVGALIAQAKVEIYNSVFVGNSAIRNQGAALFYTSAGGKVVNCVFYNNSAGSTQDGGIHIAVSYDVKNSIFWDNTAPASPNVNFAAGVTSYNCIIQGADSGAWPGGTFGADGGNNQNVDPMFSDNVNLKGVDGKWFTSDDGLRLLSGSPAIDAGVSIAGLTTDITGLAHAGAPDIGAYEGGVTPPPSLSLVPNAGFTPLTEIATNTTNAIALIFDLDTQNVGYSGNLTEITFPVTLADPSVEFTGALVYELSQGGQLVSNTPVFSGTNISFYGLNHAVSSAGNTTLELKLTTGGTFTGTNVHVEIQPTGFKFEDGAMVTGSPIATGNVALVDPFQGVSFAAGIGAEPTSFNQGDTGITLIDMDFNLANGSPGEVVEKIKIQFTQGFIGSDLDMLEVWVSGTKVGELNDFGSTWATNSTLGLPINGPTTVEIRANISPTAPSGNLSYDVSGSLMLLAGGNILVQPPVGIANIAPINPAVVSSMLTFNSQTPPNGATNVNPSDNLTLTFDEGLSGLGAGIFRIYENGSATYSYGSGSSELIINGSTLVIDPATDLLDSSNYYVTIDANMIVGLSGNQFGGFASSSEWAFTTGAGNSSSNTMTSAHRLALAQHAVYAISPSGNLSGDGDNSRYQIDSSFPMKVYGGPDFGPSQVEAVKAGAEHLMIQKAGSVYVTGSNDFGQSQGYTSLTPITGLTNIGLIEAGAYSCYAYDTSDQFLYVWGKNSSGMLGNGTQNDVSSPINITKPSGELTAMSAGVDHFLVIIGGALYGVGSDAYGQLAGIGSQTSLALIDNTMTWKEVGAGGFHSLAVTTTGELYVFGKNHQGQLGLGTTSPTVAGLTLVTGLSPVAEVAAGYDHSMIRMDDGRALGVGSNAQQQLGDFMSPQSLSWYDIGAYTDVMDIACGPYTSVFIRNDGTMEYVKLFGLLMDGPTANINVFKSYSVSNP